VRDLDLTLNDLFCGAGGLGLGFKNAGWKIVGSWDWDKWAVKSYAHNVEAHVQQADISQMVWSDLPKATAWSFGFPCQDLSVAGNQAGMIVMCNDCSTAFNMRNMDNRTCPQCSSPNLKAATRSGLFFEVMRLLQETREKAPDQLPAFILAENVKGLRPYLPVLEEEYKAIGYKMYVQLYNSKYWGVPQSRERYYVVGVREDLDIEFEHPVQQAEYIPLLSSVLESNVPEKYYMPDEKAAKIIEQAMLRVNDLKGVHATLTPDRIERRQNGRRSRESEEPMFTLTAQDIHGVIEELQTVYTDKDGCAYCCDANYAKGTSPGDVGSGRRTQIIEDKPDTFMREMMRLIQSTEMAPYEEVAAALSELSRRSMEHLSVLKEINDLREEALGKEPQIEMMGLLEIKGKDQIRRVYDPCGLSPTLTAVGGGHHEVKTFDYSRFRVRKLTPREYARLQGFPESYEFVCSNSQLYRQFGNAVTVNVAEAVARQLRITLEGI
jgi:DNA (cytosine-5)-methyltransferase 1